MFIHASADMWTPQKTEILEVAIAYASERCIPVWIFENSKMTEAATSVSNNSNKRFNSAIKERIHRQKSKSALSWISDQALSRLFEVCEFNFAAPQKTEIPEIV
jgi:hypothetical protein